MGNPTERKILIIVDNLEVGHVWGKAIQSIIGAKYTVSKTSQAQANQIFQESLDLILVDQQNSPTSSLTLCQKLRENSIIPLLFMHDQCNEEFMLSIYRLHVDEFICKPISPFLLAAKIQAWLNRSWSVPIKSLHTLQSQGLTLKPLQRLVIKNDSQMVQLTNLEFRLLYLLMGNPGRPLSTNQILDNIWDDYEGDTTQLKNLIYRLRRKIEPESAKPTYIQTISGFGYAFSTSEVAE
jgi:DNA-binding response OmpR family regulator